MAEQAVAPKMAVVPMTLEPMAELLVRRSHFSRDQILVHVSEARRAEVTLTEYLIARHLMSRGDLYELMREFHKNIPIRTVRDLPEWDTVANDAGQALGTTSDRPNGCLILALGSDLTSGIKRGFLLTTGDSKSIQRDAQLYARAASEKFEIRGKLVAAEASILDVVMAEWGTRHRVTPADASDNSAIHETWDKIIQQADSMGASDIHLSATMGRGEIGFRIHGEIEPQPYALTEEEGIQLASSMFNSMVDVGSTNGGFNSRSEQDAIITRVYPHRTLRLRYSGLPVEPGGINVTLRLIRIGVTMKAKTNAELGYSPDQCETLERIFARSSGLILFLGTTGSGKSTSMANNIMHVVKDRPGKRFRTVEEPVEIRIPGASQTSVVRGREDNGEAFISVMRALMRSDPDYLMVGEIRDPETAKLAIHAVRSGHLCVSTLHADGAPITYDRLSGMGIARSDIASVGLVAGLIYQRLVPVLCPQCKKSASAVRAQGNPSQAGIFRRLDHYLTTTNGSEKNLFFRNHLGCPHCNKRGVVDRTVCAEIMVPKPSMLQAISTGDSRGLWMEWRREIDPTHPENMTGRTAFEHALWKMGQGIVAPDDVEREFKYLDEPVFE